ncbi:MAG TPA: diguanylate cyclase [Beijerinckiaceae bacterium]
MFTETYEANLPEHLSTLQGRRLLQAYEALSAAGADLPTADAVLAMPEARAVAGDLAIIEPRADDFLYLSYGPSVAAHGRRDMTGCLIKRDGAEIGAFLGDVYARCLAVGRPLAAIHRGQADQYVNLWERLVLPARGNGGQPVIVTLILPREHQAEVLRAILDASADAILALHPLRDADGTITDAVILNANRRAAACLGASIAELTDQCLSTIMPSLQASEAWEACRRVAETRSIERFDFPCDLDGLDTWFQCTAAPLGSGFMLSLSDVTELKYAVFEMQVLKEQAERAREDLAAEIDARTMVEGELRRLAITDGLTGVLNRRGFDDVVRVEIASARRYDHPLSVIAVDIDHFKRVNDLHGHAAGDAVLMSLAAILMDELRKDTDSISRVGGEEFMVLLPHTPEIGACALAHRLREKIRATPLAFGDGLLSVTASFGVRSFSAAGDAERMLIEADDALYQAKQLGRDCVVVYGQPGRAEKPVITGPLQGDRRARA